MSPGGRTFIEQARRKQIVEAAISVIAEVGPAKASFVRIAERAGVSPALISYHFKKRQELLVEVVNHITSDMDHALTTTIGEPNSFREAMSALVEGQVRYLTRNRAEVIVLNRLLTTPDDDVLAQMARDQQAGALGELAEMIRDGQAEGEFRPFDPEVMAVTYLAAVMGVAEMLIGDPDLDTEAYGRELADLFDRAMRSD